MFDLYVSKNLKTGSRSYHFVAKRDVTEYLANQADEVAAGESTITLLDENLTKNDVSWINKVSKEALESLKEFRIYSPEHVEIDHTVTLQEILAANSESEDMIAWANNAAVGEKECFALGTFIKRVA